MEENTSRPLIIAAGLILAMLIIALAFGIYNTSKDTANDAVGQITNLSTTLSESEFTQWDGQTVTGSQVVSILKQFRNETVCIVVNNGNGAVAYIQNATLTGAGADISRATTRTDTAYISPSASFDCVINRDANTDAIIGLTFTKR